MCAKRSEGLDEIHFYHLECYDGIIFIIFLRQSKMCSVSFKHFDVEPTPIPSSLFRLQLISILFSLVALKPNLIKVNIGILNLL